MKENRHKFSTACVHSYTGTEVELKELLAMDLYIGLNGCSLKTEENARVAKLVPLDRIMLESKALMTRADSPYCEINKSHYGHPLIDSHFEAKDRKKWEQGKLVKSRNEPCKIMYPPFPLDRWLK